MMLTYRTLFKEFKIVRSKEIGIRDTDGNEATDMTQISIQKARLLSRGYLRLHFDQSHKIQYEDIASILCQYVAIPIQFSCSFFSKEKHSSCMCGKKNLAAFRTELSYDSEFVKHLVDGQCVTLPKLQIKLTVNDCINQNYGKGGYDIDYGLIQVAKSRRDIFECNLQNIETRTESIDLLTLKYKIRVFDDLDTHFLYMDCIGSIPQYWAMFSKNFCWSYVRVYSQRYIYNDNYCLKQMILLICVLKKTNKQVTYIFILSKMVKIDGYNHKNKT